jgi:hypothetical protein
MQFWIAWTLVTLAGYALGIFALLPFAVSLAYAAQLPLVIGLLSGAFLGATMGTAQWLLLRRRTPVSISWIGASIVGGMLGMALGMAVEPMEPPITSFGDATREAATLVIPWRVAWQTAVAGALFGVGIGWAQWRILRQYARSAGWWVTVNGVAWMIGLGLGALLAPLLGTLGALLVTGLLAGAVTAYHMEKWQWEMRKRTRPIPGRY